MNFAGRAGLQPDADRASRGRPGSRSRASSRARSRARATARSSASPARRPSTARRSSRPATARSTSCTTRTPATACSACTSPGRRRPGRFDESWVDILFVKGFDAGQPIVYISTDAGQPLTAVLERSTYVPALDKAAYNGGDDFLGSARERLFGFINGQTGANNEESQGFVHLVKDGHASEDASAGNTALIDALRNGGDLLNVFGDFPTLKDPRHAEAYSPLWDAQLGLWTRQGGRAGAEQAPDRRGAGLQPRRHAARPAHRRRPGDRPAGAVRLGRRRHQLRRHRVHRQGARRRTSPSPSRARSSRRASGSRTAAGPAAGPPPSHPKGARHETLIARSPLALCRADRRGRLASAATDSTGRAATVGVATTPLGRILVDAGGRTLYLFEKDKPGRSLCSGACAGYWPPLLTTGKPAAKAGRKRRCSA